MVCLGPGAVPLSLYAPGCSRSKEWREVGPKMGKEGVIDRIKYRLVIDIWDAVCCLPKTLNQYPLYPMQEEFQACKAKTISKFICRENRTTSALYGQLTKQAFTRYDM